MDSERFDGLTRMFGQVGSRRQAVLTLAAATAGARADGRLHEVGLDTESGVLEVLPQVRIGQLRRRVEKVRVERLLVVPVRRARAVRFELRKLKGVVGPGLAGRQDVAEPAAVVLAVALRSGQRRAQRSSCRRRCGNGPAPWRPIVQNGTRHRWLNRGTAPAVMAVFIVGAHRGGGPPDREVRIGAAHWRCGSMAAPVV